MAEQRAEAAEARIKELETQLEPYRESQRVNAEIEERLKELETRIGAKKVKP